MGSFSQYSAKRGSQDSFQISSSYRRGKWSFLFVLIFIEFQQNGIEYFRNDAFHSTILAVCGGSGVQRDGDKVVGLDHQRKRVRAEAMAYTGTLVINLILF
jgi:hypothetical protein